tara:strand:- start:932 stop:2368 length:1437 start_codon:yes stop_codon:yes gene_type:complete
MLNFLRKNSINIVFVIIAAFGITTFFGAIFYDQAFNDQLSSPNQQRTNIIASVGNVNVSIDAYNAVLDSLKNSLDSDKPLSSQQNDYIQLKALEDAVNQQLLMALPELNNVDVSKMELSSELDAVLTNYQVPSVSELKVLLKNNGIQFGEFKQQLKRQIKLKKFTQSKMLSIQVTSKDAILMENDFLMSQILIPYRSTTNASADPFQFALDTAQQLRLSLFDSATFDSQGRDFQSNHSVPVYSSLSWVSPSTLLPSIAREILTLEDKEISSPVLTPLGVFIIYKERMRSTDEVIPLETLQTAWRNNHYSAFLTGLKQGNELIIHDPSLRAIHYKFSGQFESAIDSFRSVSSRVPASPIPHIEIAKIFLMMGDESNAKQELLKAEIKERLLNLDDVIPELHFLLARLYHSSNIINERNNQYNKLLLSKDPLVLNALKEELENVGYTQLTNEVDARINEISLASSENKDDVNTPDELFQN